MPPNDTFEIASATGVDLQLKIAGPGARSYAFVIDWHIRVLLAMAYFAVANVVFVGSMEILDSDNENFSTYVFLVLVPAAAIYALYHLVLEIWMQGRTPGKRLAGVRIVTEDAQVPGLMAHIIRNLLRLLDSLPAGYVVGLVTALITEKAVRIGDIAAGTVLIYDTDARGQKLDSVPVYPEAIKRYGIARAELVQDLLDRWDLLEENKRADLAMQLLLKLDPQKKPASSSAAMRAQLEAALQGKPTT